MMGPYSGVFFDNIPADVDEAKVAAQATVSLGGGEEAGAVQPCEYRR